MNWKNYVEKQNAKAFVLPSGWDSRDAVAEQLGCSPERVDDHLRPALKSGQVIKQQFRVWNSALKRVMGVFAYHETSDDKTAGGGGDRGALIVRIKELHSAGKTYEQIATAAGVSTDTVRGIVRRHCR